MQESLGKKKRAVGLNFQSLNNKTKIYIEYKTRPKENKNEKYTNGRKELPNTYSTFVMHFCHVMR